MRNQVKVALEARVKPHIQHLRTKLTGLEEKFVTTKNELAMAKETIKTLNNVLITARNESQETPRKAKCQETELKKKITKLETRKATLKEVEGEKGGREVCRRGLMD